MNLLYSLLFFFLMLSSNLYKSLRVFPLKEWHKVKHEFCREELMDDRKAVVDRCEWLLPNQLKIRINQCINEIINYKRDDRPIFCYLEEYTEHIETCVLKKLSQFNYEQKANQTTLQRIEYQYKECYLLSLSQLIASTTTVLYYYDKKPIID